jgi:hypothetical protein
MPRYRAASVVRSARRGAIDGVLLIVTSHMRGYRAMGHIMSAGELAGALYI